MNPALKIIRASAGSGKTFSLTAHYLVLLFSGPAKYREILAVTFTNKATAEMKDRILTALKELADPLVAEPSFRFVIKEQYPELSNPEICTMAAKAYRAILHDYSRFSVSTIDGFVQQVIRSFAFELNLESGYKLEMNQQKVKDELVKGLNRRLEDDPGLLEWVTALAIERMNDGKDWDYQRALDSLADEIFKERYFPFQEAMRIMDVARTGEFTALKERAGKEIDAFRKGIAEKVTHLQRIVTESNVLPEELAGKSTHPILKLKKILDDEEFDYILRLEPLAADFNLWPNKALKDQRDVAMLFEGAAPYLQELADYYRDGIISYETFRAIYKNGPYLRLMQEMADLMSRYRSENRAMLISDAQGLLRGVTSSDVDNPSFIWEKTGNRYRHFLFDEFQDTSGFQWENFLPLVKNAIAEQEDVAYPGHLIVGDVKQSIYRWRNGDWRILHSQALADLGAHFISQHTLEYNRRSSSNIIDFNNLLFEVVPRLLQDQVNTLFAENGRNELNSFWAGYKEVIVDSYEGSRQLMTSQTPRGGKIEIDLLPKDVNYEDGNKTEALHRLENKLTELLRDQQFRMSGICILVKTNGEADETIRFLLAKQLVLSAAAGKPFQVISGEALKIINNPAVQLLLATLQLLAERTETSTIFRTLCARLYFELWHPEETTIAISAAGWLRLAKDPLESLGGLLPDELCRDHLAYLQLPVAELVERLIRIYRLGDPVLNAHLPYLLAFRDQVTAFSAGGDQGIGAFLTWWESEGERKALPSAEHQDAVNVMTVHKAKGLEFEAVLLPFCNWSFNTHSLPVMQKVLWVDAAKTAFPNFVSLPVDYTASLGSTVFAERYFEEVLLNYMDVLNTLYVATTRAKQYLYLVSPQKNRADFNVYDVFSTIFGDRNSFQQQFILTDNQLSFGECIANEPREDKGSEGSLLIPSYAVNDSVSAGFSGNHLPENTWFNEQQRRGSVLHEILSVVSNSGAVESLVNQSIQEGNIRESEKQEYIRAVERILDQDEISAWMKRADRVISEKNILVPGGQVERPDKVFIFGDRAILLDFKFGESKRRDDRQLERYREVLLDMDTFKEVSAYIWYDQTGTLQKIQG